MLSVPLARLGTASPTGQVGVAGACASLDARLFAGVLVPLVLRGLRLLVGSAVLGRLLLVCLALLRRAGGDGHALGRVVGAFRDGGVVRIVVVLALLWHGMFLPSVKR